MRRHQFLRSFHTSRRLLQEAAKAPSNQSSAKAAANAQEYANKALERGQKFAQAVGSSGGKFISGLGSTGARFVNFISALREPTVYYARVTGEIAKQGISSCSSVNIQCI
jgi:hypothetical protein